MAPVSAFMQREMRAIQFGAPPAGGDREYESKLRRHYSLEAIPACVSRYAHPTSLRKRSSHFEAGSMTLLDHRQRLAASKSQESITVSAAHTSPHATSSHFAVGQGATLVASAENATRLPPGAKDRNGSESINDRSASYDLVYGSQHDGKSSEDHFLSGAAMTAADNVEEEARTAERQRVRERAMADRAQSGRFERSHMGHEQASGMAGDTYAPGWKV